MSDAPALSSATVSIICRTVFRNTLGDALASVAAQSWPDIELIIVDAAGKGQQPEGLDPTRYVLVNHNSPLDRPRAANAGLQAATGDYLIFLDDDDWISPEHIEQLIKTLTKSKALACYSSTRKTLNDGTLTDEVIDEDFSLTKLRRDNFMPIHSVLFSRQLLDAGCRFDEDLAVYEDWDFWLQCSQHTMFAKASHIGAYYRTGGDSATMLDEHSQRYEPGHPMADARAKVLHKWRAIWTGSEWNEVLGLVDQTPALMQTHADLVAAHQNLAEANATIEHLNAELAELNALREDHQNLQIAHAELNLAHEELDQGVRDILNSFSWRVTAPYRYLRRRLHRWIPVAQKISESSDLNTTPVTKDQDKDGSLEGGIVLPARNNILFTQAPTIQAWAWSPESLSEITLSVDGIIITTQSQPVTEKSIDLAKRIGMAWPLDELELTPGSHLLDIKVTDNSGQSIILSRSLLFQRPSVRYQQYINKHQSQPKGSPVPETGFNVVLRLFGETDKSALATTLRSLESQSFTDFSLYVWPPGDLNTHLDTSLQQTQISTLDDIASTKNRFTVFLEPGDKLYENCFWEVAAARQPQHLVYSDHDQYDSEGKRSAPNFTWEWSPDLLLGTHYIGNVFFIRHGLLSPSILASALAVNHPAWRYSLLLTLTTTLEKTSIHRIPLSLWGASMAADHQISIDEEAAVTHYLPSLSKQQTMSKAVRVTTDSQTGYRRLYWHADTHPRVSIIIPTTGNMQFLKPCLDTLADSAYPDIELVILDNSRGSHPEGIRYAKDQGAVVIECNEAFNWSRLNNIGADKSSGELLLFLNDDIEVTDNNWLDDLVAHALRDDVGTVGCLLLYPNGTIQHGGVFLVDHGGGARHLFHKQLPGSGVYQRLDTCVREVSANTGACLMIAREKFDKLGRFDESLAVVGNDIDLCLRSLEAGFRNIWTPYSQLIHHESVSRQSKPIGKDEQSMWKRWGHRFKSGDPYYNPNLSQQREDCALKDDRLPAAPLMTSPASARPVTEKIHESSNNHSTTEKTSSEAGVNLIAYIRASMGVGEAARGNASALQAAGIPFNIINYEKGNPARMDNLRWQHKEVAEAQHAINLLHINADHTPAVIKDLGKSTFKGRYTIGFWAWEMPVFPDRWLDSFNHLDEIWVPSRYVYEAVAEKSPIPVITIPHIIDVDMDSAQTHDRTSFAIPENSFVFLSMFDTHSIAQRKNPFGSIVAFQRAFKPNDLNAHLVIKINNADEAASKSLHDMINGWDNIQIIDSHLDRAGIDSLINCCDCYVSLHHAEGFGLAPAEAMAMGKVALLTNWSGNTEYMTADNCIPIRYTLQSLGKDYGPYESYQYWATPDLDHAADEMKHIANDHERARVLGEKGRNTIREKFSADAIGKRMKARLNSISNIIQTR